MILVNYANIKVILLFNIAFYPKAHSVLRHILTPRKFGWFRHYNTSKLTDLSFNHLPNFIKKISNFQLNNKQEFGFLRYYSFLINGLIENIQHLRLKPLTYMSISTTGRQNPFEIQTKMDAGSCSFAWIREEHPI